MLSDVGECRARKGWVYPGLHRGSEALEVPRLTVSGQRVLRSRSPLLGGGAWACMAFTILLLRQQSR